MVRTEHQTGIEEFSVEDNILKRNGQQIAEFSTPICEFARLDDMLFVVLHPYLSSPDLEFAGTNLLALNLDGKIIWRARNLNPKPNEFLPVSYNDVRIFCHAGQPMVLAGTTDDYVNPIIEVETGKEVGGLGNIWPIEEIEKSLIGNSTRYALIVPGSPPKKGQHDNLQL